MQRQSSETPAYVVKRDGSRAAFAFDTITTHLEQICTRAGLDCDVQVVVQKVISMMVPGITTQELDLMASKIAIQVGAVRPAYLKLGLHIFVSNLHKTTPDTFSEAAEILHLFGIVNDDFLQDVRANKEALDAMVAHENDYMYDITGIKTMFRGYLLSMPVPEGACDERTKAIAKLVPPGFHGDHTIERPQYMLMRVAVAIWGRDLANIRKSYAAMSAQALTHATPTCFNAGLARGGNLSSCFLLTIKSDSIEGIADTWKDCAVISKGAGGIGIAISKIRASGSYISGTNGRSNGIVPMVKVFESVLRYVDQGGGKRKGSAALYLEPWHADVEDFIALRYHDGLDEHRVKDIFTALWIPDIFMRRAEANELWTLFCPTDAPMLLETWGHEFDSWYEHYEKTVPASRKRVVHASTIFTMFTKSAMESGVPYILFKDRANGTSNQQNLGTINCSNLCSEIIQYSSPDEVACCNLASIALQRFVSADGSSYDFAALEDTVRVAVRSLNKVIDVTKYPVDAARLSNFRHRPMGLGAQGLANVFMAMRMPFDSPEARDINRRIAICMYWAAVDESTLLAQQFGHYESFPGSPASKGFFQFDLWGVPAPEGYDWETTRERMKRTGLYNSLLISHMPTASTSTFLRSVETTEPLPSNIFSREALAGDFVTVNQYLVADLKALGLWSADMHTRISAEGGSIQDIEDIPDDIKALYKTRWEISPKVTLQYSADRGPFVCQSQSNNVYLADATSAKYAGIVRMAWKLGLTTGIYYLSTQSVRGAKRFAIENEVRATAPPVEKRPKLEGGACNLADKDCLACGS